MLSKIDIQFDHDWSKLINKHKRFSQVMDVKPKGVKFIDGYKANRYDFGASGSLLNYDSIVSAPDRACSLSGKIVESDIPWITKLKEDMSELKLDAISIQGNFGSLNPHIDGQESLDTVYHCKLNYIIDDYDASSFVQDGDVVLEYPSTKGTAWLLDTTKLHWVTGKGQRYVFQLCFHQKHSEVLEWFNNHPGLHYR